MNKMKRIFLLLFVLLAACALQAQENNPLKKWQNRKIEIMITAASCFAPPVYGESVVNKHIGNIPFGGSYLATYHFTNHLGLTWGFAALKYKKSFGQVIMPDNDTANFHFIPVYINYPVAFRWDINPESNVKCFINSGMSLTFYTIRPHYDGGSIHWFPPSKMANSGILLSYHLNAGIKVPVYKKLCFVAMLQYEDCFKSIIVISSNYITYTKPRFLSLHVGLCL